jgi:biopolymer transport protein ExbB
MEALFGIMSHSIFLWPVAGCAIVAGLITLERLYFLLVHASIAAAPFMAQVQREVLAGNLDAAIRICASAPRAPLANVVKAALRNAEGDREEITLAVEQATLDAVPAVQKRVGYLAMLANVVTLIGLLGTIVGLIQSFDAVSQATTEEKQTLLSKGISLAMYTTAGGISVAIPTLMAYSVLVQRGNAILDDVERHGMRVVMLLLARKKASAPVQAAE